MTRHLAVLLPLIAIAACSPQPPEPEATTTAEEPISALVVTLDADDRARLGIETAPVETTLFQPTIEGPAHVVDAQPIVAAMAELARAEAEARTSTLELRRSRDLFGSDTAVSAATLEGAERQAAASEAQLLVARANATLGYGAAAPWLDSERRAALLAGLSTGSMAVVQATFPAGSISAAPATINLRRLGDAAAPPFEAGAIWSGPADPLVPGQTVLALLPTPSGLAPGERLIASLTRGGAASGAVLPRTAVVIAGGEPWCYVQTTDAEFMRRRVELDRPLPQGYLQTKDFATGDRVVVSGAGLLLALELGGGAAAD